MIGLRFAATAQAAGVEGRVTAHSGRVGLASELTSRGASTTDDRIGLLNVLLAAGVKDGVSRAIRTLRAGEGEQECRTEAGPSR